MDLIKRGITITIAVGERSPMHARRILDLARDAYQMGFDLSSRNATALRRFVVESHSSLAELEEFLGL